METNVDSLAALMQQWRNLSEQAAAGALEIPEGVAFECDQACAEYLRHLNGMLQKTEFLVDLEAFGTLPSAQQLGRKFKRLADGEERSAAVAIRQHIEVVQLMRSVFRRYFVETEQVDRSVGARIGDIGSGLGG
ncbi:MULTISPECIES: hypothetical protein [unclassified Rhodococcus (in: high G+C Gram-positive bacteria)]|uniref:hypothetical protein n=1 Tax=unclassified Rhodococcus (in: high G+C Gram-positive bacteria) TaxID=192944 RepID=UPI0029538FA5|nr:MULTISPECIES: hypothetical protein [unclassified Rhodococcus (in: high G+C Gram-positive bacteria)]MDV8056751.1 hypothetical protein [Rhodococcus sp. IEGM 1343]MDV8076626.1 hypothetical protein [Rhodococcus sp. IEGM 1370]